MMRTLKVNNKDFLYITRGQSIEKNEVSAEALKKGQFASNQIRSMLQDNNEVLSSLLYDLNHWLKRSQCPRSLMR